MKTCGTTSKRDRPDNKKPVFYGEKSKKASGINRKSDGSKAGGKKYK